MNIYLRMMFGGAGYEFSVSIRSDRSYG